MTERLSVNQMSVEVHTETGDGRAGFSPGAGFSDSREDRHDAYRPADEPRGTTPFDVIYEGGKVRLRRYQAPAKLHRTPVVIVYALIKRPFVLDLSPGHSVIENLVRQGFEVYLTDWIPPSRADSWRGFDAYANQDLAKAVSAVQDFTGASGVNLLGYCLGGMLSLVYTALHESAVKNLVTLTTPVETDSRRNPLFRLGARLSAAQVEWITSIYGNCPAWLIRAGFTGMTPMSATFALQSIVRPAIARLRRTQRIKPGSREAEIAELFEDQQLYHAFSEWMQSDVPLAGQIARELIGEIFARNSLARGAFKIEGGEVNLRKITCPLLNIIAEHDAVVAPRSSLPLIDLVGSDDKRSLVFPAGHVGAVFSSAAHRELWPQVGAWMAERD